jgi:hypothetical protein
VLLDTHTHNMRIMGMPNKTIYVKDEALWERARQLVGKDGLSGLIAEALAEFVQRKEAESRGLAHHQICIQHDDGEESVRFVGKRIAEGVSLGRGADYLGGIADVFQTKAGKLVVVLKDAITYQAFEYRTYDTPEELVASNTFAGIPNQVEFRNAIGEALGHKWATWID